MALFFKPILVQQQEPQHSEQNIHMGCGCSPHGLLVPSSWDTHVFDQVIAAFLLSRHHPALRPGNPLGSFRKPVGTVPAVMRQEVLDG